VLAGSHAGAWIGFQAGSGLLALATTTVGAALGGNLAALVLDIWGRQPVEVEVKRALETPLESVTAYR
jgi:hypothetical protein